MSCHCCRAKNKEVVLLTGRMGADPGFDPERGAQSPGYCHGSPLEGTWEMSCGFFLTSGLGLTILRIFCRSARLCGLGAPPMDWQLKKFAGRDESGPR